MTESTLSIIIVNFNGREYIKDCVNSILKSNAKDYEIIVVDNGSRDGSSRYLKTIFKEYLNNLKIIELTRNFGPAYARNQGVKASRGNVICFLDNDTKVHKNWSYFALKEFRHNKKTGIVQCRLALDNNRNRIDYLGEYLGKNGFLIQDIEPGSFIKEAGLRKKFILAAKSAGMFIRRETFYKAGRFDPDYFIYLEETDLGLRSWLSGYKVVSLPESIVYHESGTTTLIIGKRKTNFHTKFHGSKNYIMTLIKNLELKNLIKILPLHILLWVGLAWVSLFRRNLNAFLWIHKGILWNLKNIKKTLAKRKEIQQHRIISDEILFKIIIKKKPVKYFLNKAFKKNGIGNAESF